VIKDLPDYLRTRQRLARDYVCDRDKWLKMAVSYVACSGVFLVAATIAE
jgi:glucan phosphorylase